MKIGTSQEKAEALSKIKELTEKLSGKDSEIISLGEELKEKEKEMESRMALFRDQIANIKDRIREVTASNKAQKAEMQKELSALKEALVEYEMNMMQTAA